MDMVHTVFMQSLLALDKVDDVTYGIHKGSLIYDSRNQLLNVAQQSDADNILWLDSDIQLPMNAMRTLQLDLYRGFDIVSGLYFKRKPPCDPVIYKDCFLDKLDGGKLDPVANIYKEYPKNEVFEVAAFGFGCVMMTMEAAKKVTDRFGIMPFMPFAGFGEDLSFCIRAREAGLKLWCDSNVKIGHCGYRIYGEQDYIGGIE